MSIEDLKFSSPDSQALFKRFVEIAPNLDPSTYSFVYETLRIVQQSEEIIDMLCSVLEDAHKKIQELQEEIDEIKYQ